MFSPKPDIYRTHSKFLKCNGRSGRKNIREKKTGREEERKRDGGEVKRKRRQKGAKR